MFCSKTTHSLRITFARWIPLNFRSTTDRATPLLFTWIYSCPSGGTVNFAFPLWQTWHFQFPYHECSVPVNQYSIFARLWRLFLAAYTICLELLLVWAFYSKGDATSNKLFEQVNVKERFKLFLRKFYGRQYQVPPWLTSVKWYSVARQYTMTTLHRSDYIPNHDFITELDLLPNYERCS